MWLKKSTDTVFCDCKMIIFTTFRAEKSQNFNKIFFQTIICKKYWKNCANEEKAVTTSKTLKEKTMKSRTTIASKNCGL